MPPPFLGLPENAPALMLVTSGAGGETLRTPKRGVCPKTKFTHKQKL